MTLLHRDPSARDNASHQIVLRNAKVGLRKCTGPRMTHHEQVRSTVCNRERSSLCCCFHSVVGRDSSVFCRCKQPCPNSPWAEKTYRSGVIAIVIVGTSHTHVQLKQDHTEHSVKPLELHAYAEVRNARYPQTYLEDTMSASQRSCLSIHRSVVQQHVDRIPRSHYGLSHRIMLYNHVQVLLASGYPLCGG